MLTFATATLLLVSVITTESSPLTCMYNEHLYQIRSCMSRLLLFTYLQLPDMCACKNLGSSLQGCSASDWIKCTGVVAECASACGQSITSQSCISCLGDATSQCKDCFSLAEEIKYQGILV